ncbi:MAG: hypothetical protein RI922_2103 [Bacteroidota bacterium]|jgi:triosephosphate isomerase
MRKKIVAGNWKMNLLSEEAFNLASGIREALSSVKEVQIIVFPPAVFASSIIQMNSGLNVGLQNFYPAEKGAFTGEISVSQVKNIGATHVLVGHSERRAIFNEHESFLKEKVEAALLHGLTPVFCCGEPLEIREANTELSYVKQQLIDSLFHLSSEEMMKCIVAYEPVWAIGTGKTATVEQAEAMHKAIRTWIAEQYGKEVSEEISILYGGSCNASNAKELFACENVDGGLIGGAALQVDTFITIAQAF